MKNNNPKEILDRVHLLMNYDPNKTSVENLQEQVQGAPNNTVSTIKGSHQGEPTIERGSKMVTDEDLMGETSWFRSTMEAAGPWIIPALFAIPGVGEVIAGGALGTAGGLTAAGLSGLATGARVGLMAGARAATTGAIGASTATAGALVAATAAGEASGVDLNLTHLILGKRHGVKGAVDALDGWVTMDDLGYLFLIINGLQGKCALDDTQDPPVKVPAMTRFAQLYSEDENGEDLIATINSVGTRTLPVGAERLKGKIIALIEKLENSPCVGDNSPSGPNPPSGGGGGKYKPCPGPTFTQGCYNISIQLLQGCLGLVQDGKFGPKTYAAIKAKIPTFDGTLTPEIIAELMKDCKSGGNSSGAMTDADLTKLMNEKIIRKGSINGGVQTYFIPKEYMGQVNLPALDALLKTKGYERASDADTQTIGGVKMGAMWYVPTKNLPRNPGIRPPSQQPKSEIPMPSMPGQSQTLAERAIAKFEKSKLLKEQPLYDPSHPDSPQRTQLYSDPYFKGDWNANKLPICVQELPGGSTGVSKYGNYIKIPEGIDAQSVGKKGLYFWQNGQVGSGDRTLTGTYTCLGGEPDPNSPYKNIKITWRQSPVTGTTGTTEPGGTTPKSGYKPCANFPFTQGCTNDMIKQLQTCLGLVADGAFGPKTLAAIKVKIPTFDGNLTQSIFDEIMKTCNKSVPGGPSPAPPANAEGQSLHNIPIIKNGVNNPSGQGGLQMDTPENTYHRYRPQIFQRPVDQAYIYKGAEINPESLSKLNEYFAGKGWRQSKVDPTKDYGAKYVWKK